MPSIIGIAFMMFATFLAVAFWPKFISFLLAKIPPRQGEGKVSRQDEAVMLLQFVVLIIYAFITHLCGTHLWGCFIAGMSFACLDHKCTDAHHIWSRQTKRVTTWLIRIFFSATVGFSIPVAQLLSLDAFWKGSILGIGPCILAKVLCAPFMGPPRFVIGWAMVGRAEFAYLIGQMAKAAGMIDEETFSIIIWALLWATILAPLIFRYVLQRYIAKNEIKTEEPGSVRCLAALTPFGGDDDVCGVSALTPENLPADLEGAARKVSGDNSGIRKISGDLAKKISGDIIRKTSDTLKTMQEGQTPQYDAPEATAV